MNIINRFNYPSPILCIPYREEAQYFSQIQHIFLLQGHNLHNKSDRTHHIYPKFGKNHLLGYKARLARNKLFKHIKGIYDPTICHKMHQQIQRRVFLFVSKPHLQHDILDSSLCINQYFNSIFYTNHLQVSSGHQTQSNSGLNIKYIFLLQTSCNQDRGNLQALLGYTGHYILNIQYSILHRCQLHD